MRTELRLWRRRGWGSAIVEAQLDALDLPFTFVEAGDVFADAAAHERLAAINPLAQMPTLVLPDGRVMTESAAITLHLADVTGRDDFVPRAGEPARAAFLRWLIFLVANVYPTFTYADEPRRFVDDETAAKAFRDRVDAYAQRLWRIVDGAAQAPWFLGERFTALDVYLAVMTHWRPKRPWFDAHAPRLHAIAVRCDADPRLAAAWRRNVLTP
jgi:GST-like protein